MLNGFSGLGFKKLVKGLCSVCVDSGFNIAKNGLYPYTKVYEIQRFSCSHTFFYCGNTTQRSQRDYRKITYHCDWKNSQGKKACI